MQIEEQETEGEGWVCLYRSLEGCDWCVFPLLKLHFNKLRFVSKDHTTNQIRLGGLSNDDESEQDEFLEV